MSSPLPIDRINNHFFTDGPVYSVSLLGTIALESFDDADYVQIWSQSYNSIDVRPTLHYQRFKEDGTSPDTAPYLIPAPPGVNNYWTGLISSCDLSGGNFVIALSAWSGSSAYVLRINQFPAIMSEIIIPGGNVALHRDFLGSDYYLATAQTTGGILTTTREIFLYRVMQFGPDILGDPATLVTQTALSNILSVISIAENAGNVCVVYRQQTEYKVLTWGFLGVSNVQTLTSDTTSSKLTISAINNGDDYFAIYAGPSSSGEIQEFTVYYLNQFGTIDRSYTKRIVDTTNLPLILDTGDIIFDSASVGANVNFGPLTWSILAEPYLFPNWMSRSFWIVKMTPYGEFEPVTPEYFLYPVADLTASGASVVPYSNGLAVELYTGNFILTSLFDFTIQTEPLALQTQLWSPTGYQFQEMSPNFGSPILVASEPGYLISTGSGWSSNQMKMAARGSNGSVVYVSLKNFDTDEYRVTYYYYNSQLQLEIPPVEFGTESSPIPSQIVEYWPNNSLIQGLRTGAVIHSERMGQHLILDPVGNIWRNTLFSNTPFYGFEVLATVSTLDGGFVNVGRLVLNTHCLAIFYDPYGNTRQIVSVENLELRTGTESVLIPSATLLSNGNVLIYYQYRDGVTNLRFRIYTSMGIAVTNKIQIDDIYVPTTGLDPYDNYKAYALDNDTFTVDVVKRINPLNLFYLNGQIDSKWRYVYNNDGSAITNYRITDRGILARDGYHYGPNIPPANTIFKYSNDTDQVISTGYNAPYNLKPIASGIDNRSREEGVNWQANIDYVLQLYDGTLALGGFDLVTGPTGSNLYIQYAASEPLPNVIWDPSSVVGPDCSLYTSPLVINKIPYAMIADGNYSLAEGLDVIQTLTGSPFYMLLKQTHNTSPAKYLIQRFDTDGVSPDSNSTTITISGYSSQTPTYVPGCGMLGDQVVFGFVFDNQTHIIRYQNGAKQSQVSTVATSTCLGTVDGNTYYAAGVEDGTTIKFYTFVPGAPDVLQDVQTVLVATNLIMGTMLHTGSAWIIFYTEAQVAKAIVYDPVLNSILNTQTLDEAGFTIAGKMRARLVNSNSQVLVYLPAGTYISAYYTLDLNADIVDNKVVPRVEENNLLYEEPALLSDMSIIYPLLGFSSNINPWAYGPALYKLQPDGCACKITTEMLTLDLAANNYYDVSFEPVKVFVLADDTILAIQSVRWNGLSAAPPSVRNDLPVPWQLIAPEGYDYVKDPFVPDGTVVSTQEVLNGSYKAVASAARADGSVVIIVHDEAVGGVVSVTMHYLDGDLQSVISPVNVQTSYQEYGVYKRAQGLMDGSVVLVGTLNSSTTANVLYMTMWNPAGVEMVHKQVLLDVTSESYTFSPWEYYVEDTENIVLGLRTGGFAVSVGGNFTGSNASCPAILILVDSAGATVNTVIVDDGRNAPTPYGCFTAGVNQLSDGNILYVWETFDSSTYNPSQVYFSILNLQGEVVVPKTACGTVDGNLWYTCALINGGFAIDWAVLENPLNVDTGDAYVFYRTYFDNQGTQTQQERLRLRSYNYYNESSDRLAPDGRVYDVREDYSYATSDYYTLIAEFDGAYGDLIAREPFTLPLNQTASPRRMFTLFDGRQAFTTSHFYGSVIDDTTGVELYYLPLNTDEPVAPTGITGETGFTGGDPGPGPGELILASDYSDLTGELPSTQAYPDLISCVNRVSALWGVGFGTFGYGQTIPAIVPPVPSDLVTADKWQQMITTVYAMAEHQGVVVGAIPTLNSLQPGEVVLATGYDYPTALNLISNNRLQSIDETMVVEPATTSTFNSTWGTQLTHEFTCDFVIEDAARWFFNSGGSIRIAASLVTTGEPHNASWRDLLIAMGTVSINHNNTTQSGTGGTSAGVGYYNLTNNYQTVFIQYAADAPYTSNNIQIQARREAFVGARGGNGSRIRVLVLFDDAYEGVGDTVSGVLTSTITTRRADGVVSVSAPRTITTQQLNNSAPPPGFVFDDVISTNITDYDLLTRAVAAGYDSQGGVFPLYVTVRLTNGAHMLASTTSAHACTINALPPQSTVTLVVEPGCVIAGRGGAGGTGAPSGVCGCPSGVAGGNGGSALRLLTNTLIQNYGIIGGGGGGGGGGGAECSYVWLASAGGGGGGAGFGAPGDTNPCGVTENRFGSPGATGGLLMGGTGGAGGNSFVASGGAGGNLGQPGQAGASISTLGGAGGNSGLSVQGISFVVTGSVLGDMRGQTS
jgi:hypothetical protein